MGEIKRGNGNSITNGRELAADVEPITSANEQPHAAVAQTLARCRSCDQSGLKIVLSLGHTPLANALLTAEQLNEPEAFYPLDLAFCPNCSLVQITETVPPEKLFREY